MMRTITAFRQSVFSILTSPQLAYVVNGAAPQVLPVASVRGEPPWVTGADAAPDPLVNFSVASRGRQSLELRDRHIELRIWISSASGPDVVTALAEAVLARIAPESADASSSSALSRAAAPSTLPIVVRELRESSVLPAAFEKESQRWWISATFSAIAL